MLLTESNFADVEVLAEQEGELKQFFLQGTFMQADVVNKNRRIYPLPIMENEVTRYNREYVVPKRAVGELSHPESPSINLDKITHLTEEIYKEGKNFIGKARVLNTPSGNIVKGLLEGGVRLGVSSRATGSVRKNQHGINEVQDDFRLAAIDVVYQPSAPEAFVEGLMENADFVWDTLSEDTEFVESLKDDMKKAKKNELREAKLDAFQRFLNRLKQG